MAIIAFDKCVAKINTEKLLSALKSDVPNIRTIGIIEADAETDEKLQRVIYGDNRRFAKVGFAYIIMDLSEEETIKFGRRIKQSSVIWGQKIEGSIRFNLVEKGNIVKSRTLEESGFYIPFFDDTKDETLKIEIDRELSLDSNNFPSDNPKVKRIIEYIRAHNEHAINEANTNYKWLENWNVISAMKELKAFSEI